MGVKKFKIHPVSVAKILVTKNEFVKIQSPISAPIAQSKNL